MEEESLGELDLQKHLHEAQRKIAELQVQVHASILAEQRHKERKAELEAKLAERMLEHADRQLERMKLPTLS